MNKIHEAMELLNKLDTPLKSDFEFSDIIIFDDVSVIDFEDEEDLDGAYKELEESGKKTNKYIISKEEVANVLTKLRNCSKINQNDYYKTTKFLRQNKLTLSDCLDIIHNLKVEDYYANTYSTNPDHLNNVLIIFAPQVVTLSDGRTFDNLIIYLKIDLDETTDEAIALVSLHKGDRRANTYISWLNNFYML